VNLKFLNIAVRKELIVKSVITDRTTMNDVKKMTEIISQHKESKFALILQPVTPVNDEIKEPDEEMLSFFKGYIAKETGKEVRVLGQVHKYLGVK